MSSENDALLIETIRAIRERLNELASLGLASYELSKANEENLKNHMRRSEANEKRLDKLENLVEAAMRPVQWFKTTGKVFAWIAGASSAVAAVGKLFGLF
jgi:NADPH-dependent ferric siderophore reductase